LSSIKSKTYEFGFILTPDEYAPYLHFIERKCVERFGSNLTSIEYVDDIDALKITISDESSDVSYVVTIRASRFPTITIESSRPAPIDTFVDLTIDFQFFTYQFIANLDEATLGLVFIPGLPIIPSKQLSVGRRILSRILAGNLLALLLIFLVFGYFMFAILKEYAPIGILASQIAVFMLSHKIISYLGDWTLSSSNGELHVAICKLSRMDFRKLVVKRWSDVMKIKRQIYAKTLAVGKSITPEVVSEVLRSWGVHCPPSKVAIRVVPMYRLIREVVDAYNAPMPLTIVANTFIPNAAATGPALRFARLLVTSGLAFTLNDEEIKAVIGHEISHLINRDPLILLIISSIEYLARVYILWELRWPFDLIYFIFSITLLYFVAKFLEARADLESAFKLKLSGALSNALMKIGFRRLFYERYRGYRIQRWLGWDPHPPIYFRVLRLENLKLDGKPKSLLLKSARECISGFISTLSF